MFIDWITLLLGIATVGVSAYLGYKFFRVKHKLSRAMGYALFGEAVAGAVTVTFMTSYLLTGSEAISHSTALILRWTLFLAMLCTSLHLYLTYKDVERGD